MSVSELLFLQLQLSLWLLLPKPRRELLLPAQLVPNALAVPTVLKLERRLRYCLSEIL